MSFTVREGWVGGCPTAQEQRPLLTLPSPMAPHPSRYLPGHIVDDNSFPWQTATLPSLSALGAYPPAAAHSYSPSDVQGLLAYAQGRGIRVVVELDTPGHTQSWGKAAPGLTTACYSASGQPDGTHGPIDPTREENWALLGALLAEAAQVFPDQYMHIGGDEVSFACWASNPSITAWMAAHGLAGDYAGLESYYVQRVLGLVQGLGRTPIGWQEVFDNHLNLTQRTIVNVWKYHNAPCVGGGGGAGGADVAGGDGPCHSSWLPGPAVPPLVPQCHCLCARLGGLLPAGAPELYWHPSAEGAGDWGGAEHVGGVR